MNQKILILLIVLISLFAGVALGGGGYYLATQNKKIQSNPVVQKKVVPHQAVKLPDTISGVISVSATTKTATLKDSSGKIYTLWPSQPKAAFDYLKAKDGQRVQVSGKILDSNVLYWFYIK